MFELHRRGHVRVATTANCGLPAGQYDVAPGRLAAALHQGARDDARLAGGLPESGRPCRGLGRSAGTRRQPQAPPRAGSAWPDRRGRHHPRARLCGIGAATRLQAVLQSRLRYRPCPRRHVTVCAYAATPPIFRRRPTLDRNTVQSADGARSKPKIKPRIKPKFVPVSQRTERSGPRTGAPVEFRNGCCSCCGSPLPTTRRTNRRHPLWPMRLTRSACGGDPRRQVSFAGRAPKSARPSSRAMIPGGPRYSTAISRVSTMFACGAPFKPRSSASKARHPSPARPGDGICGQVCARS
jgi:hypothetical protein